jgi:hypothetical protein
MSPPNQTPQPDDVPDSPQKKELDDGVLESIDALSVASKPKAEEPVVLENDGEEADKSCDAGQTVAERDAAGMAPVAIEKGATEVGGEHGTDVQTVEVQTRPVEQEPALQQPKDATESTAEATAQAEAPARTLTPPPDPTEKAAGKAPVRSPSPPPPPPKDDKYLATSNVPSRTTSPVSHGKSSGRNSEDADAVEYASKYDGGNDAHNGSQSEIQSIMEQFEHGDGGPGAEEIMSPRLELASPLLESPTAAHPPRRSSLIPLDKPLPTPTEESSPEQSTRPPPLRTSSLYRVGTNSSTNDLMSSGRVMSPSAHAPQYQKPAPPPDPEPDLPFDFHRFLEQLRHRTADPVAKFLRSFLLEFGKKQWMVHEQVKIIGDFLEFISKKMGQCDVWRTVSDAEFDNAREGMEKLVMNRLYSQTFSPAIPPPEPVPHTKGRRRQEPAGPGRRGQHQEDVERDEVLAQKVRIYKWIREEHLDIKSVGDKGKKFLHLAQQELIKIKSYRAPRDKVICILNCCKVIFGYLRTSSSDQSADAFVPLLIYTVLQANPDHLVSNVQYILRFRNQDKLGGEAGYYISSLMGAVQFIEGLDRTSLTVSDEEFEKNVEAAVSAIAERHAPDEPTTPDPTAAAPQLHLQTQSPHTPGHRRMPSPHLHLSEKSSLAHPEVTQRNSLEAEQAGPRRSTSQRNSAHKTEVDQPEEENAAVAGLLRTIQKPLSTIGRIFSDNDTTTTASSSNPANTPQPGNTPRLTPQPPQQGRRSSEYGQAEYNEKQRRSGEQERARQRLSAEDAAARQASAEAEEARKIQRQEHKVVVETLAGMFPQLDRDVIDDVVRMKEGRYVHFFPSLHDYANAYIRVGLAVDACLALANP